MGRRAFFLSGGHCDGGIASKKRRKTMFQKVSTDLNFVEREKEVSQLWKERDVFKRSIDQR